MNVRVDVSLLSPCSVFAVTLIPCTHRMAQDVRVFVSSHPCMKWAFLPTSLISSSPSSSFFHSSSTSSSSCYPSTSSRLSSKIPCATSSKRWGLLTSPSPTQDEEVTLLVSVGVLKQLGSVIVAEKTVEFQTFQNVKDPAHLTLDLQPKHASALQRQLTPQMWELARQGQEVTILRPSSERLVWPYHQSHIMLP